jgi:hypothetical protein
MPAARCCPTAAGSSANSSGQTKVEAGVVNATLAIGDFMLMLAMAALWVGGGILFAALAGAGALGGLALAARHWWRHH